MTKLNKNIKYVITENLEDHIDYHGQPVTIVGANSERFYIVQDEDKNRWCCGEEELQPV